MRVWSFGFIGVWSSGLLGRAHMHVDIEIHVDVASAHVRVCCVYVAVYTCADAASDTTSGLPGSTHTHTRVGTLQL